MSQPTPKHLSMYLEGRDKKKGMEEELWKETNHKAEQKPAAEEKQSGSLPRTHW